MIVDMSISEVPNGLNFMVPPVTFDEDASGSLEIPFQVVTVKIVCLQLNGRLLWLPKKYPIKIAAVSVTVYPSTGAPNAFPVMPKSGTSSMKRVSMTVVSVRDLNAS